MRLILKQQLWKDEALHWKPSLKILGSKTFLPAFDKLVEAAQRGDQTNEIKAWGKKLQEAMSTTSWFAGEKIGLVGEIIKEIENFSQADELKIPL